MKKIVISLTLIVSSLANTAFGAMVLPPPAPNAIDAMYTPATFDTTLPMCSALPWLSTPSRFDVGQEALVDQKLYHTAEVQGYGYKTANLHELEQLIKDPKLQTTLKEFGCSAHVPAFMGIASPAIATYLESNGINLTYEWAKIVETITPETSEHAFASKQLSPAFAQAVKDLGLRLKNFFDEQATAIEQCGFLRSYLQRFFGSSSFVDQILPFVKAAREANQTFIVRSTGMEDKKGLANAGGNESIKHVQPTIPAILRAIGQVLASYFSAKSLSQRLISGDKSIFSLPATPALLQVMVNAPAGGHRPIECVIHTTEQAGPTPGLTSLNCGYGVVESTQRADQCFHFHTGQGHCTRAKGVEHLPENILQALTALAAQIEHSDQRATDVELLVDTATGAISIVQKRPLNRPAKLVSPSYVANLTTIAPENSISAQTVIPAGSSVRHITTQQQIIVAPTLSAALIRYLAPGVDTAAVLAIVVQGGAEPNSHEATNFAAEGKLVMVAHDYEKVTAWHATPSLNLYLDPQHEFIINPGTTALTVAEGCITHPMTAHVSIEAPATAATLPFTIEDHLPAATIDELITNLKQGSVEDAHIALATLIARINHHVATAQHDIVCATAPAICTDALTKLATLENFARQKAVDMLPRLTLPAYDLQRLAAVKPVEALLAQEEDAAYVDTYSVTSVMKQFEQRKTFVENYLPTMPHVPVELTSNPILLDVASNGVQELVTKDGFANAWVSFTSTIATLDKAQQEMFTQLLSILNSFSIFPLWINTVFTSQASKPEYSNIAIVTPALLQRFTHEVEQSKLLLQQAQGQIALINSFNLANWESSPLFDQTKEQLSQIAALFTRPEFIENLDAENQLLRLVTFGALKQFIDFFDSSIKTLQGCPTYSSQKPEHFQQLLSLDFDILESLAKITYPNPNHQIRMHISELRKRFTVILPTADQLLLSQDFDVRCAISPTNSCFPQTLVDFFTTIHQYSLNILATIQQQIPSVPKPQWVKKFETELPRKVGFLGCNIDDTFIKCEYNWPIDCHSIQLTLEIDKKSPHKILHVKFSGQARDRNKTGWMLLSKYATTYAQIAGFNISIEQICSTRLTPGSDGTYGSPEGDGTYMAFKLMLDEATNQSKLVQYIEILAAYSKYSQPPTEFLLHDIITLAETEDLKEFAEKLMLAATNPIFPSATIPALLPTLEELTQDPSVNQHTTLTERIQKLFQEHHYLEADSQSSINFAAVNTLIPLLDQSNQRHYSYLEKLASTLLLYMFDRTQTDHSSILHTLEIIWQRGIGIENAMTLIRQNVNTEDNAEVVLQLINSLVEVMPRIEQPQAELFTQQAIRYIKLPLGNVRHEAYSLLKNLLEKKIACINQKIIVLLQHNLHEHVDAYHTLECINLIHRHYPIFMDSFSFKDIINATITGKSDFMRFAVNHSITISILLLQINAHHITPSDLFDYAIQHELHAHQKSIFEKIDQKKSAPWVKEEEKARGIIPEYEYLVRTIIAVLTSTVKTDRQGIAEAREALKIWQNCPIEPRNLGDIRDLQAALEKYA